MIITRQMRQLPSRAGGTVMVEMVYCDTPATAKTWDDHAAALAKEYGIDETEAHVRLMFAFPKWYGLLTIALMLFVGVAHAENLAQPYPAPYHRAPDCIKERVDGCITYGGLRPARGYERDHFIPLCLLGEDIAADDPSSPPGPDNPGNVWYQPKPAAHKKDGEEDSLCRAYRNGEISLEDAQQELRENWGE